MLPCRGPQQALGDHSLDDASLGNAAKVLAAEIQGVLLWTPGSLTGVLEGYFKEVSRDRPYKGYIRPGWEYFGL